MGQIFLVFKDKRVKYFLYPAIVLGGFYCIGMILGSFWYILEHILSYFK